MVPSFLPFFLFELEFSGVQLKACRAKTALRGDINLQSRPEATEPRVWFSFTVWVRPTAGRGEEGVWRKEGEGGGGEGRGGGRGRWEGEEEQEEALTVPLDPVQFGIQSFTKGCSVLQPPASSLQPPARIARRDRVLRPWSPFLLVGRVAARKRDLVRGKYVSW